MDVCLLLTLLISQLMSAGIYFAHDTLLASLLHSILKDRCFDIASSVILGAKIG